MSNYTVSPNDGFSAPGKWTVWHAPSITRLSEHETQREAKAAVKRYEAADSRRAAAAEAGRRHD